MILSELICSYQNKGSQENVSGSLNEKWQLSVYQRKNKEKVSEKSDLIIPPQGSTFMLKNPKITVE